MPIWKQQLLRRYHNEQGEFGGAGGGGAGDAGGGADDFDMASAVEEISAGLGFGEGDNDAGTGDGKSGAAGGDQSGAPAPSPAPTPAPSPAPSPAPTAAPAPGATPAPSSAPAAGPGPADLTKPPGTWSATGQAAWATLPEAARAEIHKREQDMWKGLEQYKGEAGFAKDVRTALGAALPMLQQANFHPAQFIQNMTNTHLLLADPQTPAEQKRDLALNILKQYGIELDVKPAENMGFVDPEVKSLKEQLSALQSKISGQEASAANQTRQKLQSEIAAFAADPANPYFNEVADDMVVLLKGSGGTLSLKEAYERAVRANPVTFAKEKARLETEAVAKAQKEAADRAAAAKKAAAANVRNRGHQAGRTADATGSWDDTMKETLDNIKSKAH